MRLFNSAPIPSAVHYYPCLLLRVTRNRGKCAVRRGVCDVAGRECRDDRLTRPMGSTVVTFLTHYPHSLEDSWSIPRAARGENSCEPFTEFVRALLGNSAGRICAEILAVGRLGVGQTSLFSCANVTLFDYVRIRRARYDTSYARCAGLQ